MKDFFLCVSVVIFFFLFHLCRLIERDEQKQEYADAHCDQNVLLRRARQKANEQGREQNHNRRGEQDVGRARREHMLEFLVGLRHFHLHLVSRAL